MKISSIVKVGLSLLLVIILASCRSQSGYVDGKQIRQEADGSTAFLIHLRDNSENGNKGMHHTIRVNKATYFSVTEGEYVELKEGTYIRSEKQVWIS